MKVCPNCNFRNREQSKFCAECGTKLGNVAKFCPECGTKLEENPKFCPECGFNLTATELDSSDDDSEDNTWNSSSEEYLGDNNSYSGTDDDDEEYDDDDEEYDDDDEEYDDDDEEYDDDDEEYDDDDDDEEYDDNDDEEYDDNDDDDGEYEEYVDEDEYRDEETTEEKIIKILDYWLPHVVKESCRWITKSGGTFENLTQQQRLQNGLTKIGRGYIKSNEVLGFIDLSMMGKSGKDAILFTEKGIAFDHAFEPIFINYCEMKDLSIRRKKLCFGKETIWRSHKNGKRWGGTEPEILDSFINTVALKDCLEEIIAIV